jgi:hypothetical protein
MRSIGILAPCLDPDLYPGIPHAGPSAGQTVLFVISPTVLLPVHPCKDALCAVCEKYKLICYDAIPVDNGCLGIDAEKMLLP